MIYARKAAATPRAAVRASDTGALKPAAPEPPAVPGRFPELPESSLSSLSEVALAAAAEADRDADADAAVACALAEASSEESAVAGVKTGEDAAPAREDAPALEAVLALIDGAVADAVADGEPSTWWYG